VAPLRRLIESNSVVRDSFREVQPLQPLLVVERRLNLERSDARQNVFCERQDPFHVEFVDCFSVW
jgi:hypothetical protein